MRINQVIIARLMPMRGKMKGRFLAALLLASASLSGSAQATQDFKDFIIGVAQATFPLGSGAKFAIVQNGVTKYVQADQMATLSQPETFTNKTINGTSNTLTVLAATQLSGVTPVPNGGTGLATYTSGGIPCATGTTTLASSALLTANEFLIGGGAGACPAVGSRTSTTSTKVVTYTGSGPTSGAGASFDASGNLVQNTFAVFTNVAQTFSAQQIFASVKGGHNTQIGTSYTLQDSDCGKTVILTNSSAVTISTFQPVTGDCTIAVLQQGTGQVTVANGSGATKHNAHGFSSTFAQYAIIGVYNDSATDWIITGDAALP